MHTYLRGTSHMQAFMVFVFRPPEANFQPTQKRTTTVDVFVQQMEIFSWIKVSKFRKQFLESSILLNKTQKNRVQDRSIKCS